MIQTPGFVWTVAFFLIAIGPLIFLHELGHYLVGRWCGVKADVFSIGMGRELIGWTDKAGTRWKLSAFPLGGYVKFAGDMNAASQADPEWQTLPEAERNQTFAAKPVWKRALIVAAGPVTNLIVAAIIFAGLFSVYGQLKTPPIVSAVSAGSPAERAGFRPGDRITAIGDTAITEFDQMRSIVALRPGVLMDFHIDRAGKSEVITAAPAATILRDRFGNVSRLGQLGLASARSELVKPGLFELPGAAVAETISVLGSMIDGIGQIIMGRVSVKELGGPIKIAQYSGQTATLGLFSFLTFMALISINLGFINLLPIPMLDGGHLTFYAVEAVLGKPVNEAAQEWAYRGGFALLIGFMLFVTFNDLASFGVWTGLTRLIG